MYKTHNRLEGNSKDYRVMYQDNWDGIPYVDEDAPF